MDLSGLLHFKFLGIPALAYYIFFSRIMDVSLGTLRIVFISRGYRNSAAIFGFFEVTIWILAAGQVIKNINTPILILAYAFGYAAGNYIGIWIEAKLRLGNVILRIITKEDASAMITYLRSINYGVTKLAAEGTEGQVHVIFMVVRRESLPNLDEIIQKYHPNAFLSVEDVREVQEGNFPASRLDKMMGFFERK